MRKLRLPVAMSNESIDSGGLGVKEVGDAALLLRRGHRNLQRAKLLAC